MDFSRRGAPTANALMKSFIGCVRDEFLNLN
jgi:hypothetical protein